MRAWRRLIGRPTACRFGQGPSAQAAHGADSPNAASRADTGCGARARRPACTDRVESPTGDGSRPTHADFHGGRRARQGGEEGTKAFRKTVSSVLYEEEGARESYIEAILGHAPRTVNARHYRRVPDQKAAGNDPTLYRSDPLRTHPRRGRPAFRGRDPGRRGRWNSARQPLCAGCRSPFDTRCGRRDRRLHSLKRSCVARAFRPGRLR